MTQTTAAQRAEAARLVALHTSGGGWWSDDVADSLLALLPALLADAEALAEREADDAARKERTRAALTRLAKLSEELGLYDREDPPADAADPPIVTPAVPSRAVMVRIVGRKRVLSAKYPEGMIDAD